MHRHVKCKKSIGSTRVQSFRKTSIAATFNNPKQLNHEVQK